MAQIVTAQPGATVVVTQTQVLRNWNSGLLSCFDDIGSCLTGWCCPCFLLYSISSRMGEGCLYAYCCSEIAPFTLRAKLRTEHHIQGSLCNDALTIMCCPTCALCQMARELNSVGKQSGVLLENINEDMHVQLSCVAFFGVFLLNLYFESFIGQCEAQDFVFSCRLLLGVIVCIFSWS